MKFNSIFLTLFLASLSGLCACSKLGSGGGSAASGVSILYNGPSVPLLAGKNVMRVTVNGYNCAPNSYPNKPCVNVTVCEPHTSNCQTINDILLDTGSYGLRIFKSTVPNLNLNPILDGSGKAITECQSFVDNSSDWGPVVAADVVLGGENAVTIPVQLIDSNFFSANIPSTCGTPDTTPASAGFNGILGVGLFAEDCGSSCISPHTNNGVYYACDASGCTGTAVALSNQVVNPVAALSTDNNGVILTLPHVELGGVTNADGYLILGIGTQSNNTPIGVTALTANSVGEFTTLFSGTNYVSFIDSGSNAMYFKSPSSSSLPNCSGANSAWYCPSSVLTYTATNKAASGNLTSPVSFQIGNFDNLWSQSNYSTFAEIGASMSGQFDLGLPFYFGRSVYVGIKGRTSSLGTGPYWAY